MCCKLDTVFWMGRVASPRVAPTLQKQRGMKNLKTNSRTQFHINPSAGLAIGRKRALRNLFLALSIVVSVVVSTNAHAAPPGTTDEAVAVSDITGFWRLGSGVGFPDGEAAWPINVGAWFNVSSDSSVMVGVDTGLIFAEYGTLFPLLASANVFLGPIENTSLQPFIGGSLGPAFGLSGYGSSLAALVRPGLFVNLVRSFDMSLEVPLGSMAADFYIAPQVNLLVYL